MAQAPKAKVPTATIQRVVSEEYAYCQRTETATASQLEQLSAEIERAIHQKEQTVKSLVADSLAVEKALTEAQAKVSEIETEIGNVQAERNPTRTALKRIEDQLARLERGSASADGPSEHAQLMAQEAALRQLIASLTAQIAKLRQVQGTGGPIRHSGDDVQKFFQGMTAEEGPVAELRKAEKDLADVMERLRAIRKETIPIRFSAEYQELQRKLADQDRRIDEIQTRLDAARKTRDTKKTERDNYNLAPLELAYAEFLFLYDHLTRAQHCVDKRRQQLNQAAAPIATTTAGTFSGEYGVFCKFTNPDYGEMADGGTVTLTLDGKGGVSGTYAGGNGSYAVGGSVRPDGSAGGDGTGSGWSVTWGGRLGQAGGGVVGNGNVGVTITNYGGGTCTGTWSIP